MSSATNEADDGRHRHLTQKDEMSLTDEESAQTRDSDPDTLEVRDDSLAILQGTMNELRGPMLMVVVVVGAAALVVVGLTMLTRAAKRGSRLRPA